MEESSTEKNQTTKSRKIYKIQAGILIAYAVVPIIFVLIDFAIFGEYNGPRALFFDAIQLASAVLLATALAITSAISIKRFFTVKPKYLITYILISAGLVTSINALIDGVSFIVKNGL